MSKKLSIWILGLGMVFSLTSCKLKMEGPLESAPPESKPDAAVEAAAQPSVPKTLDLSQASTLNGVVNFDGPALEKKMLSVKGNPECAALHEGGMVMSEELLAQDGKLQNVVIYVKEGLEGYSFDKPASPVLIENKKCQYVPHVSVAMTGQEIQFMNADSTLHNIHSYPQHAKAFNLGLPLVGMKQTKKIDTPEVAIKLKCDVHPWMLGYVAVLPHPYGKVTGADGLFQLKDLPPGTYTIEAWHETLGTQTQTVTLGPSESKELSFTFKA